MRVSFIDETYLVFELGFKTIYLFFSLQILLLKLAFLLALRLEGLLEYFGLFPFLHKSLTWILGFIMIRCLFRHFERFYST